MKRVLIITSCTGEKYHKPQNQLLLEDFQNEVIFSMREAELAPYRMTAGEIYTGRQHVALMRGVHDYRHAGGVVDVTVLSAGYGMLREQDEVVPYEVTFNNMTGTQVLEWSRTIQVKSTLEKWIADYDLIFFLLGDKYLSAVDLPLQVREDQQLIFFAGESSKARVMLQPNASMITIGTNEASRFHSGLIEIKGFLFAKLLQYAIEHPEQDVWTALYHSPALVRDYILEIVMPVNHQVELFEDQGDAHTYLAYNSYTPPMHVPSDLFARNYQAELNYYMPENDDRVDPGYDFATDEHTAERNPLQDDFYAHQFFGTPQYDGILISKVNIDKATKKKQELIRQHSIRHFLRLPDTTKIMGDCGAFSYISQEVPPYTTEEVLDYYESLGYDYGVSVDHLIVGNIEKDVAERQRRYDITRDNARDFIEKWNEGDYHFTPIGVAQGWDPASFKKAVQELIEMGYTYIALGGLAKEKSVKIFEILKEIAPIIPNADFRIHLFGVARDMEIMESFHKLGITSFDSASPLRRAWLDSRHNYYAPTRTYAALRIPEAKFERGRLKHVSDEAEFNKIKQLEITALQMVRSYGHNEQDDLEATLDAILAYNDHLGGNRKQHAALYRDALQDRPWSLCDCPICTQHGIDVIIFRGNNRNRRRGFHNTYVYYQQLLKLREKIFAPVTTS